MTKFVDQVRIRLISQLIKSISRVLKKLPRDFNSTAISASTVPSSPVLFVNLNLKLNDLELLKLPYGYL